MSKGNAGGMLGVGGTRSKLSRGALRGGGANGRGKSAADAQDPQEQRRALLEKMRQRSRSA
ncbi:DUF6243 family protein [Streptomyces sp. NPDC058000]|uniref:DUF6243 family protein n=1 Tax=Streptomyces sp. NPDC058000 TaxID=3346299 RepID=UPI0036E860B0